MVRLERFERPTYWFVASCSIQLSYGRTLLCMQLFKDNGICCAEQPVDEGALDVYCAVSMSWRTAIAALRPLMPMTLPPGCVQAPQR